MKYHPIAEGNSQQQKNSRSLGRAGDVVRAAVTFLVTVHDACIIAYMRLCTLLCNHHHEASSVGLHGFQKYVLLCIGL